MENTMPKRKFNNDQTVVFRIADSDNNTIAFINLDDELEVADYQYFEANLSKLMESDQVNVIASPLGGNRGKLDTSKFTIK